MENTFDIAYSTFSSWTADQCARMIDALQSRLGSETDAALEASGQFADAPRYQPIPEEQLRQELLSAQRAYAEGRHTDALAFCERMEARHP